VSNIIFGNEYDVLPGLLLAERRRVGLSQKALALRMGRSPTHVHKIETRQRRIEVVEFCRYVWALGGDPVVTLGRFVDCTRGEEMSA
jgi:hypothetical protein